MRSSQLCAKPALTPLKASDSSSYTTTEEQYMKELAFGVLLFTSISFCQTPGKERDTLPALLEEGKHPMKARFGNWLGVTTVKD